MANNEKEFANKRDRFIEKGNRKPKSIYLIAAAVVILLAIAAGLYSKSSGESTGVQPDPREAKYIGRYLQKGYKASQLTDLIEYEKRIDAADVKPVVKDGAVRIEAGDIIKNRIVYFEYTRASDNKLIPVTAYIKPSGKLFTGVSLCRPCQAKRQYIDADGQLTCVACGTKRDLETQAGISGACKLYPLDELPHEMEGEKITISENLLNSWEEQPFDRPVGEE